MIESNVASFIKNQIDITRSVLPLQTAMLEPNITTIPQMIYPDIVNVITIGKDRPNNNLFSAELCCGTHLHNTSHVSSFVITSQRKVSQTERLLHVVTGKQAQSVIGFGNRLIEEVLQMEKIVEKEELKQVDNIEPDIMKSVIVDIKQERKTLRDCLVPLRKQMTIYEKIDTIERKIKSLIRRYTKTKGIQKMQDEIRKAMQNDKNYFVHKIETVGDENQLIKAAVETFGNKPVMFFVPNLGNNQVLCQCLVPPRCVTSTFSAKTWMASVLEVLDGEGNSKKQNPEHFFSMTGKKMENLCEAIETSKMFAERHLKL
ncbi:alanine--tRNA ligase, mitochondrial-like isoform X1 [Centruroides sculpturatus]|uniref:alanine--tRNA ligase, mitochondrial-like isoform X1 n=1 Tax=Centruroides sculpturatus TaxID=218467 RepID=UPI000C6E0ACE|nr:alanine--tRNA ligase, mitochondrial-like isoform X1 [Centruroides sculpturatus]